MDYVSAGIILVLVIAIFVVFSHFSISLFKQEIRKLKAIVKKQEDAIVELQRPADPPQKEVKEVLKKRPIAKDAMLQAIQKLTLGSIQRKLAETYPDWEDARVDAALLGYRRFLYFFGTTPTPYVVPWNSDIGAVWKTHVFFLKNYTDTCMELFGELISPDRMPARNSDDYKNSIDYFSQLAQSTFVDNGLRPARAEIKVTTISEPWLKTFGAPLESTPQRSGGRLGKD